MKRRDDAQQPAGTRKPYERPTIHTYDEEELLEIIGPAQAYSGQLPGAGTGM